MLEIGLCTVLCTSQNDRLLPNVVQVGVQHHSAA